MVGFSEQLTRQRVRVWAHILTHIRSNSINAGTGSPEGRWQGWNARSKRRLGDDDKWFKTKCVCVCVWERERERERERNLDIMNKKRMRNRRRRRIFLFLPVGETNPLSLEDGGEEVKEEKQTDYSMTEEETLVRKWRWRWTRKKNSKRRTRSTKRRGRRKE